MNLFICNIYFIAALFKVPKKWKQLTCPLIDEWVNKIWCIYIYTSNGVLFSLKKNEALIHTTSGMNVKDFILNEISQTQKDKYSMIPLT